MPASHRQFSITVESYLELQKELSPLPSQPKSISPAVGKILSEIGPFPREALFLGVASDGLPVLLNLHDPIPGPMLVIGDGGAGKTKFLQSLVLSLMQTHQPEDLQYGVVTNRPNEWDEIEVTSHRVAVFSMDDNKAQDLILSLASWAHQNKNTRQSVLLMVDDLEAFAGLDYDTLQNFRWLLAHGTSRRVWPIVTMNPERYGHVLSWIPSFRTRIFGRITNEFSANALGGDKKSGLDQLEAPNQFSLRENDSWIRFRLPE